MNRAACLALAALLLGATAPAVRADGGSALGFVHVEANVGGASGGHTALRLGDRVWHFQLGHERLLGLKREDWELFRFKYNVLQNRPLHTAWVPVRAEALRRIRDHLNEVHLLQHRERNARAELRRDLGLTQALLGKREGVPTRGAGLLDPQAPPDPDGAALASRIDGQLGGGLAGRIAQADAALAGLPADDPTAWREAISWRAALHALRDAAPLAAGAAVSASGVPLADAERASLIALRRGLEATIVRLADSTRPDRGGALWVALARHRAAGHSLEQDRLILVDPLPDDAHVLAGRAVAVRRAELAAVADFLEVRLASTRRAVLDGGPPRERQIARLEALAARAAGYRHAAASGEPLREAEGALLVPQRSRDLPLPHSLGSLAPPAGLEVLQRRLARAAERLSERWAYDLFRDNCVTALAETLDEALGGPEPVRAELGGHVASDEILAFWPLVYFGKVARRMRVSELETSAAHRSRELAALRGGAHPVALWARESNTLSSSIYRPRDADGSFLLFTDGSPWTRPLFGAVNLLWATADAGLGLASAPFDRGRRLERAGKGMLFSVPELFFVNIRKGTFDARTLDLARRDGR